MGLSSRRNLFFLIALACAAAIGFALYAQHVLGLEPCPLCIFQRVGVMAVGSIALLAAIHNPGRTGGRLWAGLGIVAALAGGGVAARHVWLQHLPPDQVPACGPGLDYMLETMPMSNVLSKVLKGSGECASIDWTFLGMSMPFWTGVLFAAMLLLLLMAFFSKK
ncbi:disulfide bond formation protein B [Pseudogulbenkiania sp. MAI-1]|uniref:disulfide bond formation protein B n=1 Tax=Pseudogulbenkiania sp. MAI-1 TaxID=990370 RepID=UPI00045E82A3|nr:disulfide bond formation protein B [Pseudogulbenkiania sp. MAI-1]